MRLAGRPISGAMAVLTVGAVFVAEALARLTAPPPEDSGPALPAIGGNVITSPFGKIDPSRGLLDKIDHFCVTKLKVDKPLEELHVQLGAPETINPLDVLHKKEAFALGLPVFLFLIFGLIDLPPFLAVIGIPVGFSLPEMMLRGQVSARQKEIMRNFPTMVDLAALTIESGLDYMQAFEKIIKVAREKTQLEVEMERMLTESSLGYTRRDALSRFRDRCGLQEIRSFVGLIIQSDELGTSLVGLLRNFGGDLRYRRIQNAEKAAAQAATKMLIPMFVFIFPVVFIAMLAPMVLQLVTGGMPF
jgi:tight adherence protein C